MRCVAESDKRISGSPAHVEKHRSAGGSKRFGKKGAPSEDGALRKWGKRTREEETPFAYGPCRGRRIRLSPVSGDAGPREEGAVRRLSDKVNMLFARVFSNAAANMPAMRSARGRSACLTFLRACWRLFFQQRERSREWRPQVPLLSYYNALRGDLATQRAAGDTANMARSRAEGIVECKDVAGVADERRRIARFGDVGVPAAETIRPCSRGEQGQELTEARELPARRNTVGRGGRVARWRRGAV